MPTTLTCPGIVRQIRLEPLTPRHAPDLFAVADREIFAHTMQAPREWSVRGFEKECEELARLPQTVALAIVLIRGDHAERAIGRTTFMHIRAESRGLEIGRTWIGRAYHGTRVNPEAKYLMLRHAFEALRPPALRVQFTTNHKNLHSQAAIAKLGAMREGVLRQSGIMPANLFRTEPEVRDWVMYSILQDEWPNVRSRLESRLGRSEAE